jgi:predicted ATPase
VTWSGVAALRPRAGLLVLDNCEHLVAACAGLADVLVEACPGVRLLATSREPLGVAGEAVWPVPPLPVPPGAAAGALPPAADLTRCAAVRLFAERAAAVRPGFAVAAGNAAAVAQICWWLDGLPLALELAAARVRVLPRQQTLQATVDWSFALLAPPEQALFAALGVFAGGWTLDAAEAVGPDNVSPPRHALG